MNKKLNEFFREQKNRDVFSGISTTLIVSLFLLLLFAWEIDLNEQEEQAMVEIAPPLDFKELNLNDLKVDANNSGKSSSNNNKNNKTNNPNKIVSNKNGGDESKPGSKNQSNNPFGNGGTGTNGNGFGNGDNGTGNGDDSRGNSGGPGIERILVRTPSIPKYEINYDCKISLKVYLKDDGTARSVSVVKKETNCNDQSIINDVIAKVKRGILYNNRKENAIDYAFFTIKIESR